MASPPPSLGMDDLYDPSQPFKGVVLCCTSIPAELRSEIDAKTKNLGGIHKYDLTPDVTHLIVGEYDTLKYRHVAKDRPDIRAMAAGWVDAVLHLWKDDADMDFDALEKEWQLRALETSGGDPNAPEDAPEFQRGRLICSVSGFDEAEERQLIIDKIESNGGIYTGDLTRKATHLIVRRPEGKKYAAAKKWEIHTVVPQWLDDSIARGLILNESCYDPCLPAEEIGVGAWNRKEVRRVSLGKRLREGAAAVQEQGKRKLRKTASMKLSSQRDNLWGDILGSRAEASFDQSVQSARASPFDEVPTQPATGMSLQQRPSATNSRESAISSLAGSSDGDSVFASCGFYIHGFSDQKTEILANTVSCLGGLVCQSLDEVISASGAQLSHRFVIVPQKSTAESHPKIPETVYIITEFYIEKCLHRKSFVGPTDHVIGRPFPVFPIEGFETLTVCTGGFTGVDLNQVDKAIRQLGAKYEERFTAHVSVLVCHSLATVRKQKLDLALSWKVPVVSGDWLWECISTGFKVPIKAYLFKELKQKLSPEALHLEPATKANKSSIDSEFESQGPADPHAQKAKKPGIRDIDMSAFETGDRATAQPKPLRSEESKGESTTTNFETAPTHQSRSHSPSNGSGPLSEVSSNALNNRSPNPQRGEKSDSPVKVPRQPMARVVSEIADSEATDGDVGDSTLLLAVDVTEQLMSQVEPEAAPEPEPEPDHAPSKRRLAEQKAARQAAERLAIGSKFTTLFDAPATVPVVAGDELLTRTTSAPAPGARPTRRKREIFGRAISNASVGSAGSNEENGSGKAKSAAGSFTAALASGRGGADALDSDNSELDADPVSKVPASTQLGYVDEQARRAQEMVMSRLMGTSGRTTRSTQARAAGMSAGGGLTISDVAGMHAEGGADGGATQGRRARRRG
ncbi:hypothetical protein GQ53DRAFT_711001 [Thozetella sp. PMI_491]|nr:hypothetical protein GQ53DRAFT_711001 [Thozetella sp. PMI_491]